MKINKGIVIAGMALVSMAACKQEMIAPSETDITAKVTEMVDARKAEMQAMCNQSLMTEANAAADRILVADANKPARTVAAPAPAPAPRRAAAPKATPKPKATPAPAPEPKKQTVGNGKPKMGGSASGTVGNGKPKMGGSSNAAEGAEKTIGSGKPKMGGK